MDAFSRILTALADLLVVPFGAQRAAALLVLSLLVGAALALVFRATSNQERIRRSRDVFKARVLEMRLYPDDIVLITRALGGAIASQGSYLKAALKPILVVLVLALPLYFQVESRFAARPLAAGERVLVTATLKPGLDPHSVAVRLEAPHGVRVDPRSVRVAATREVVWRVGVDRSANHLLTLHALDRVYAFTLRGAGDARPVPRARTAGKADTIVHPGMPTFRDDSPLAGVHVSYPEATYRLAGIRWSWLGLFLVGSLAGAIIPAWILRIQL